MSQKKTHSPCINCGETVSVNFCPECGHMVGVKHDLALRWFLTHFLTEMTSLDGKFLRSLKALMSKPGHLTTAYLAGARGRYVKPLQLYLVINLIIFVIGTNFGLLNFRLDTYERIPAYAEMVETELQSTGLSPEVHRERFNLTLFCKQSSLIFIMVPIWTIILKLVLWRQRRYYAEHFILAVHAFSFLLLLLLAMGLPLYLAAKLMPQVLQAVAGFLEPVLTSLLVCSVAMYHYRAARVVYRQARLTTMVKVLAMTAGLVLVQIGYWHFPFLHTFWFIRLTG